MLSNGTRLDRKVKVREEVVEVKNEEKKVDGEEVFKNLPLPAAQKVELVTDSKNHSVKEIIITLKK